VLPPVRAHLHSTPNPPTPPPPTSPQEDSSEYETDSEEEEAGGGRRLVKPVFVPKSQREVRLHGGSWPEGGGGGEGVCHPGASLCWAMKTMQVWWLTGVLCCEGRLLLLPPPPCWPLPIYESMHAHYAAPLPPLHPLTPHAHRPLLSGSGWRPRRRRQQRRPRSGWRSARWAAGGEGQGAAVRCCSTAHCGHVATSAQPPCIQGCAGQVLWSYVWAYPCIPCPPPHIPCQHVMPPPPTHPPGPTPPG
jgi:hypothetical protein